MAIPDLRPCEVLLVPTEDVLLRNVHPSFIDGELLSSQAFGPNTGDEGQLSVAQAAIVQSLHAYMDYTVTRGLKSVGVWAVSTLEVDGLGARSVDDRACDASLPEGHAYVDFRDLTSKRAEKRRATALRDAAQLRGCQFSPERCTVSLPRPQSA